MRLRAARNFRHVSADSRRRNVRSAFTLLELLLVLGVIVVLAAMSWPRLTGIMKRQSVLGNAEQVRQLCDRARVRAVEEGQTLQLRYEPHGRHYVLLPHEPVDPGAQPSASTSGISPGAVPAAPYRVHQISEDCQFHVDSALVSGQKLEVERLADPWLAQLENGAAARDIAWSLPILFFPDGSATDGQLTVLDRDRRYINLSIRGLTGTVQVSPIEILAQRLGRTGTGP